MNDLEVRSQIVDALSTTLRRSLNLKQVPSLVEECLKRDAWREFRTERGEVVRYGENEFGLFLVTEPLKGLGGSEDGFIAVLRAAGRDDLVARVRDLLTVEPLAAAGGARSSGQVSATNLTPDASYLLRRLKRDAPEVAAQVAAGVVSPNRAAVMAGIRHGYLRVRTDDVDRAVTRLLEFYAADDIRAALRRRAR